MGETFQTTVKAFGNNTGIEVPAEVVEQLGAGKRPPVLVNVNGYEYRNTVAVMGGKYLIGISAAIREETGLKGGDPIRVELTVADTPREVNVPEDFAAALSAEPAAQTFFDGLSNSLQRYHVNNITGAKTEETRQRRIEKAVALFLDGKQRDAAAKVPDAFVDDVALIGPRERIAERLAAWRESGATSLLVSARDANTLRTVAEAAQ